MAIRVVQLGSPRQDDEGPRIGTVRRPPRGVRKADYARLDFYDVWLPQLAPSPSLVAMARKRPDAAGWKQFERRYARELSSPDTSRLLDLLAAFSRSTNFSVGCYCEEETKCHRSILRTVLAAHGALLA
jgi:uncharacterized protein YeaO (DUF488 family)